VRHPRTSVLDAYRPAIFAQWQAGANAMTIFRTIRAQGYQGQQTSVRHLVQQWRDAGTAPPLPPRLVSPREVRWLLARATEHLTVPERAQRLTLLGASSEALAVFTLYLRFWTMLRERTHDGLLLWLAQAEQTGLPELRAFAAGVHRDLPAVQNGLREQWSQGRVEGCITKLKLLKRQCYGRAKVDLLQQHLVHPV
jgi:transposase